MNRPRFKSSLQQAIREYTDKLHAEIAQAALEFPDKTYRQLANEFGVSESTVLVATSKHGISRPSGPKPKPKPKNNDQHSDEVRSGTPGKEGEQDA